MPQRFSDPFAAVRSLAQRRSGMFDPAKERRRVNALERGARSRQGGGGWRPETVSEPPACDDGSYGRGVTVYSDTQTDRLEVCVTDAGGEFASRPLAFADEQLVRGFASSGGCNTNQSSGAATAQTLSVNLGTEYQWQCLVTGSVTGGGDMDVRLDGPVTTGWHNAGREADTNNSGSHSHSISNAGNHDHGIANYSGHSHSIATESAHQHGIANGGAHSHAIPNDGGHAHGIGTSGNHSHTITVGSKGNHRHNSATPIAGLHDHKAESGSAGSHTHGGGSTGNAGSHNHGGTDSGGSHTHGNGTTGTAGNHNHGGQTGSDGAHSHGGSTGQGGNHNHGGDTGNGGNHSHTVEANASGTVARVLNNLTGNTTVRLEYRSASSKQARCYSAALTAVCWRVG